MRTDPVVTEVRVGQGCLGGDPGLGIEQQHFLKRNVNTFFFCFFPSISLPPGGPERAGQSLGRDLQCSGAGC